MAYRERKKRGGGFLPIPRTAAFLWSIKGLLDQCGALKIRVPRLIATSCTAVLDIILLFSKPPNDCWLCAVSWSVGIVDYLANFDEAAEAKNTPLTGGIF